MADTTQRVTTVLDIDPRPGVAGHDALRAAEKKHADQIASLLKRLDEQDDILIPGPLLSDVEAHQGLRVRAAPERLTDEIGQLNWEATR